MYTNDKSLILIITDNKISGNIYKIIYGLSSFGEPPAVEEILY